MRKMLLLAMGLLLCVTQLLAQNRTITGKVTDESGNPIPNATVMVKGTTVGTTTKVDGTFSLSVPASATAIVISSVNMETKEVALGNQSTFDITLIQANRNLDEVVVTAYGSTRKQAFTGTASTIKEESFKNLQVSSVTSVLQGNASGVLSVSTNGQPGESPTIRIRGIASVNASADPIIVVDGAVYGGNINSINPGDIESITILKDASSTALYGSRAANGVISITTKSGKGPAKFSFSALTGWSKRAVKDYDYINTDQLYELTWEALRNQAIDNPGILPLGVSPEEYASQTVASRLVYNPYGKPQPVGLDGKVTSSQKLWEEDWSSLLLRTGIRHDVNFSIAGSSEKTRYFISGGYLGDQGIPIESQFKRYTGRLKLDTRVNSWLTAGLNTNLAYSTQNYPVQGGSAYSNIISFIRSVPSLYPVYLRDTATGAFILDANGNKQYDFGDNGQVRRPVLSPANPIATTSMNPTTYDRFITTANVFAEAEFVKGLKFRTQYVLDYYQYASNVYYNPFVGDGAAYGGRSNKQRDNTSSQTFTNTLTYDNIFGDIHHVNILAGMESYKYLIGSVSAEARGFSFPGVTELGYAATPYLATSASYPLRMVSYFSRVNYDLNEKYHLSFSLRRDGTSRFADSSRWGTFYSVGAAWNIARENFMQSITAINDLKLRFSIGTLGNQDLLDYFPYLGGYATGWNIADYSGSIIGGANNGDLHWETQANLDLGIDFSILKNRISGSVTYFRKESKGLLFNRPLPPSSGLSGIDDNIGKNRNVGIEVDLSTVNVRTASFEWSTTINFTHIKNRFVELPQETIDRGNFRWEVGQPMYSFFIREYAGVDAADGRPMWYMDVVDGDKTIKTVTKTYSEATRYYAGSALPDWTGGVTNTVRYKGFDLSVLLAFSIGGKIYDADYAGLMHSFNGTYTGYNASVDILGRWQSPENPGDGKTPRLHATADDQGNLTSTRFLYDASYTRIRNITLGYQLPRSVTTKAKINHARFFVNWQNPFTFFGRKGLDPESGLDGITNNRSTTYRTLSVGLNLEF